MRLIACTECGAEHKASHYPRGRTYPLGRATKCVNCRPGTKGGGGKKSEGWKQPDLHPGCQTLLYGKVLVFTERKTEKKCDECKQTKHVDEFHKAKHGLLGRKGRCAVCENKADRNKRAMKSA